MKKLMQHKRWIIIALVSITLGYVLGGFFGVPLVVRHWILPKLSANLNGEIQVERIAFNPFTLRATLDEITIEANDQTQPFALQQFVLHINPATIWRRGIHLYSLTLDEPNIYAHLNAYGQFNIAELFNTQKARITVETYILPTLVIDELNVIEGSIHAEDSLFDPPLEQTIEPLTFTLTEFRTVPNNDNLFKINALTADNERVVWEGKFQIDPFQVAGSLELHDVNLDRYFIYIDPYVPIRIDSGILSLTLDYAFEPLATPRKLSASLNTLNLENLVLVDDAEDVPFYTLKHLHIDTFAGEMVSRELQLGSIELADGHLHIERRADGSIALLELIDRLGTLNTVHVRKPLPATDQIDMPPGFWDELPPEIAKPDNAFVSQARLEVGQIRDAITEIIAHVMDPWQLNIGHIALTKQSITFHDAASAEPMTFSITEGKISTDGFKSVDGYNIPLTINAFIDDHAHFQAKGIFEPFKPNIALDFKLDGLKLDPINAYWQQYIHATLADGVLSIEGHANATLIDKAPALQFKGDLQLDSLDLQDAAGEPVLHWQALGIQGIDLDTQTPSLEVAQVYLQQPQLHAAINADGKLSLLDLLSDNAIDLLDNPPANTPGTHLQLLVHEVELSDDQVLWIDALHANPSDTITLDQLRVAIASFTLDADQPASLELTSRINAQAALSITGLLHPAEYEADVALTLADFNLTPVNNYWGQWINAELESGTLALEGRVNLAWQHAQTPTLRYKGHADIADFNLQQKDGEQAIAWEQLHVHDIELHNTPLSMHMAEIELDKMVAYAGMDEAGNITLMQMLASDASAAEHDLQGLPDISIDRFVLKNSLAIVQDAYLGASVYQVRLEDLRATLTDITTDSNVQTHFDIRTRVEGTSPVRVTGSSYFLAPLRETTVNLNVSNLALKSLDPYATRYAGHEIDRGVVNLNSHYSVTNAALQGNNEIHLDATYLGRRVDSPDRLNVPFKLGLDLLRDRREQININVPVQGNLSDPAFSITGLVMQAITNVIDRVVGSPFDLLAGLVPAAQEVDHLDVLPREPLAASLQNDDDKKLDILTEALNQRPALRAKVIGVVDETSDGNMLRQQILAQKSQQLHETFSQNRPLNRKYAPLLEDASDDTEAGTRLLYLARVVSQASLTAAIDEPLTTNTPGMDAVDASSSSTTTTQTEVDVVNVIGDGDVKEVVIRETVRTPSTTAKAEKPRHTTTLAEYEPAAPVQPIDIDKKLLVLQELDIREIESLPSREQMQSQLMVTVPMPREALEKLAHERSETVYNYLVEQAGLSEDRLDRDILILELDDDLPFDDDLPASRVTFEITD